MKLVNIHKHLLVLLMVLPGLNRLPAQVWSLQQCIDSAQVYNKNLQISRNNRIIGKQKEKDAKARLLPTVTANADYKYFSNLPYQLLPLSALNPTAPEGVYRDAQFGVPHNINANLQLTMPLYHPQVYGAIKTSQITSELSELQLQKTEEQIYFEISNLYYNAQILQHQLVFIDSNLVNAQKLLANMQLLKEQLLATSTDVSKVALQVNQLSTQKERIDSEYTQVLNALKFAMGISLERRILVELSIPEQVPTPYTQASTLEYRLASAQGRLIANELSVLKKSRSLPALNLFATYGTTGFAYNGQPESFLNFYPIGFAGIQFSYPLFNGTVTQRKINQKALELRNNVLQRELLSTQNNMEVENARMQREIARSTVANTSEQVELAQAIYQQSVLQQKQGTANLTDVLLADNALRETQQTYLSAIIDYLKAELELRKMTGNISMHN